MWREEEKRNVKTLFVLSTLSNKTSKRVFCVSMVTQAICCRKATNTALQTPKMTVDFSFQREM
jgi:hypothetical protein